MKLWLCLLLLVILCACKDEKPPYPVYKVDFDQPDEVLPAGLFTKVKAIPFQTTEKSHFIMGELGVKGDRYYILDRNRQLFFCFDTTGKFRYVMDNKPKDKDKPYNPHQRSILNPYSYYYKKKWHFYLTFRNVVYTKDKEGNQHIAYMWDFGKYNDDKEVTLRFTPLQPQILFRIQQAWMKANSAFVLTNTRESSKYIYTSVERIDSTLTGDERFFHLLCYKPTGKCYYFNGFSNGMSLDKQVRLEDNCLLMLMPWWEKEKYENLDILDDESRKIVGGIKVTDNPILLKWHLKS